jgi:hypothetical protein
MRTSISGLLRQRICKKRNKAVSKSVIKIHAWSHFNADALLQTNDVGELSAGAAYYIKTPKKLSERQATILRNKNTPIMVFLLGKMV